MTNLTDTPEHSVPGQYAVIGNPVAHSRSPQIHTAFGEQTGTRLNYNKLAAEPDQFEASVKAFAARGGRGLNVTVPFKEQAVSLAGQVTERARNAGAANTLVMTSTGIAADNTDGIGLVNDLTQRHGVNLQDAALVLIGAGGAARGVLQPLLEAGIASLWITNRTLARAEQLAVLARGLSGPAARNVRATPLADLGQVCAQLNLTPSTPLLLINATAAGLSGQGLDLPQALLARATLAYDMVYADQPTPFMTQASLAGCSQVVDGLGMLVEQAAESFFIWHGIRPQTDPVYALLRSGHQ